MYMLAVRWQMRSDNPAKGLERNLEEKRTRYLSAAELPVLIAALNNHDQRQGANIIRWLLLSGARRGESLSAKWTQIDFGRVSGQNRQRRRNSAKNIACRGVNLALALLCDIPNDTPYLFPVIPHRFAASRYQADNHVRSDPSSRTKTSTQRCSKYVGTTQFRSESAGRFRPAHARAERLARGGTHVRRPVGDEPHLAENPQIKIRSARMGPGHSGEASFMQVPSVAGVRPRLRIKSHVFYLPRAKSSIMHQLDAQPFSSLSES
jgi:integrase